LIDQKHEGDNIDFLNPWYCELTGLYYLWKNVQDDIVGLEHYRRYFVNSKFQLLTEYEINALLNDYKYDFICVYSPYNKQPVISWINKHNMNTEFTKFLIFCKYYVGEEYVNYCWKILNGNYHALGNMFISKKETFNEYCEFIFDLFFTYQEAEKHYGRNIPGRMIGYFAEFLFAAWLEMKHKKIFWNMYKLVK
jgi:hypothetical protein